jgi:hypothetical protein
VHVPPAPRAGHAGVFPEGRVLKRPASGGPENGNLFVSGDQDLTPAGLIGSILGAVIALLVYRAASKRRMA